MCGLLRSTRTMQVRPERHIHGRPGPAVYYPSPDWPPEITPARATSTRAILLFLLVNSTQCTNVCYIEFRGTNASTLLFFCFSAQHIQPVDVLDVALYSSLVLQQSPLVGTSQ